MTAIGAGAVLVAAATVGPAHAQPTIAGAADAIADRFIVVLKDNGRADAVVDRAPGRVTHRYRAALNGFAATMGEDEARRLAADPDVALVARDRVFRAAVDQFDPPWGLDRVDQRDLPLNQRFTEADSGSGVHVYVLDSGIRTTHADFGGRATFDYNGLDNVNSDCNGHGTHVAGTVGGTTHGVAKQVRLHAVKVLDCEGTGTLSSVIAGVDWVTANHVRPAVANMSLSGGGDALVDAAVQRSIDAGVTYAVAAGNHRSNACELSPARIPDALTVAASDAADRRAVFSNRGPCVDLFAPGTSVKSTWNTGDYATAYLDGTSMASPHVAGAAALHLSAHPDDSPAAVRAALVGNATPGRVADAAETPNRLLFTGVPTPATPGEDRITRGERLTPGQSKRSPNGAFRLTMQTDGNLVQYTAYGEALWSTGTWGTDAAYAILQPDGNFVLYSAAGVPRWDTRTWGTAAERFEVQDDSNLVLYGPSRQVFWARWS
ncbi:S8 family serine peptidase [Saccharothrix obliqua]|uniref:S8 family serine peptidase n=1 Tax=Saccharothrix obliqua TaxID=2861747 RepID=UPI0021513B25|nr:S8 family serine peptidase [Saccharothrix obliqua]